MSLPKFVINIVSEVIEHLNPYFVYKKLISINYNTISIKDTNVEIQGKLHLFATGKAASYELAALKKLIENSSLKNNLAKCVSLTKEGHTVEDDSIFQLEGTHPVVTSKNLVVTKEFISQLSDVPSEDTIIFLLSGGASALLEYPIEGMSFNDLQKTHENLLNSGKNINEMNQIRKSLSQVKDGGLLNFIETNNIIQLVTCDIPNENLADVSSGPLLGSDLNSHPKTFMTQSASILMQNLCTNESFRIKGKIYDCLLSEMEADLMNQLPKQGEVHISAGEATIHVPVEHGMGGRNTHFVLSFASKLYQDESNRDIHILSFGTDGGDGPTDAAGAYINFDIYKSNNGLEYLEAFNSYEFFNKVGTLIKTGPTKTNVMDIRFLWRE